MSQYQPQETTKNCLDLKVLNEKRGLEKLAIFESMEGAVALTGSMKKLKTEKSFNVKAFAPSEIANELIGYEVNGEKYFFSQDPYKPLRIISEKDFLNRMKQLDEEELTEMMIVEWFMGRPIKEYLYGVAVTAELFKFRNDNTSEGSNVGYTGKALLIYNRRTSEGMDIHIDFQFAEKKRIYTTSNVEAMYRYFIFNVQRKVEEGHSLNNLSNWELIAWYKLKKYDVMFNVVTSEWTITKAFTTKVMYVEREELNNFNKVISDFNNFIILNEENPRLDSYENRYIKEKIDCKFIDKYPQNIKLKRYDLSQVSTVLNGVLNKKVELRHTYKVSSDDGKYVTLMPYNENENVPVVKMPRKDVRFVQQADSDGKSGFLTAPYAIPVDVENSLKGVKGEVEHFESSALEFELKQSLALDHFLGNIQFIQAIVERDEEVAKTFIDKNGSPRVTAMELRYDGLTKKGQAHYTKRLGVVVKASTKELYEIFIDMYSAVKNLPTEELTLFELELKYKLDYNERLKATGIRGFYIIGLENVHTTKYDLLDIDGTMAKLGYKKSSEKEICDQWIY